MSYPWIRRHQIGGGRGIERERRERKRRRIGETEGGKGRRKRWRITEASYTWYKKCIFSPSHPS